MIGNGFEIPPATDPLPHFPGFSWASQGKAARSERVAVANANRVLDAFGAAPIKALQELMTRSRRLLATFPELDHYGERSDVEYIGPLLGRPAAARVEWPEGTGPKTFAYVRPHTNGVENILSA